MTYYTMTSDPGDDYALDLDALAARVQHTADTLAQQDADYAEGCMPDPNAEGDF